MLTKAPVVIDHIKTKQTYCCVVSSLEAIEGLVIAFKWPFFHGRSNNRSPTDQLVCVQISLKNHIPPRAHYQVILTPRSPANSITSFKATTPTINDVSSL